MLLEITLEGLKDLLSKIPLVCRLWDETILVSYEIVDSPGLNKSGAIFELNHGQLSILKHVIVLHLLYFGHVIDPDVLELNLSFVEHHPDGLCPSVSIEVIQFAAGELTAGLLGVHRVIFGEPSVLMIINQIDALVA